MKKTSPAKRIHRPRLQLNRTTVRKLNRPELEQAAGGFRLAFQTESERGFRCCCDSEFDCEASVEAWC